MTAETDPPLNERLRSATQGVVPRHADQTFRRLIGLAPLLRDWREAGYSHAQIHEMLSAEGLTCRPGTLRGYVARILEAEEAFRLRNGRAPAPHELRGLCGRGRKPSRVSAIKPIRSAGGPRATTNPSAPLRRATTFDETEL